MEESGILIFYSTSTAFMSSIPNNRLLDDFSQSTKAFLFYFYKAINCLAPISRQDEDSTPSATMLSNRAQALMEDIIQELRWFRNENQSSARQMGDLDLQLATIQSATNHAEPWTAWHQSLTIDNVKEKIGEASQVYGQDGLGRLSQLQENIIQFHKEAVLLTQENINAKLIRQDRAEDHEEDLQVGFNSVEVPIGEPSDLVTFCLTIGLAVVKPFVQVFCHKKARAHGREIEAIKTEVQVDKATLKVLKTRGDEIKSANLAIDGCHKALTDMKEIMFTSVSEHAEVLSEPGQSITQLNLGFMRSRVGKILIAQRYFKVELDEFLNEIENPEHGLVKSPTTLLIEKFHYKANDVSKLVGYLLSAKQIIREEHRTSFLENSCKIAKELAEILNKVKDVFISWSRHKKQGISAPISCKLRKDAVAVTSSLIPFDREIRKCFDEITRILEKKHEKSNSKWLQKWQKDGDRVLDGQKWAGRPLATTLEAKDVVQKLEDVTDAILKISNEIMLPLLEYSGENDGHNLPTGKRSGREPLQAVPESTLDMISTSLSVESLNLKSFGSKSLAHA